ncbi:carbon-nitrogen hydrolase family protein [Aeoliella sp.]|uniref:carbon-nitrogen hydrolase family protein n=1 Tax=Aeoliella sp. TaxID=2795800 RepID=UPI003CCBDC3B
MPDRREFLGLLGAGGLAATGVVTSASEVRQPVHATGDGLVVALMQATPAANDQKQNLDIAVEYCKQAADQGADIVLMPEMWNIGYQGFTDYDDQSVQRWQSQAVETNGPWVGRFKSLASELGIAIAATYLQKWPESPRNAVTLFDRQGNEVLTYAKVHTCDFAFEVALTPGDKWYVGDLETKRGQVKIGAMICFDREFPESMRSLMLAGAELVLTPNACLLDPLRIAQFQVRAYENATAVAIANYPRGLNNGQSTAFDASGQALVEPSEAPGLKFASIDLKSLRAYRNSTLWGNAWRRPHRYEKLTEQVNLPIFERKNAYGQPFNSSDR